MAGEWWSADPEIGKSLMGRRSSDQGRCEVTAWGGGELLWVVRTSVRGITKYYGNGRD